MKRNDGFTRFELVTVLCVVGMLVALLLPALARAKEASNQEKCEANLQAIGMALASYAHKNSDLMPQSASFSHPDWLQTGGKWKLMLSWTESLVMDGDVNQETNRNGKLDTRGTQHYPATGYGIFGCPANVPEVVNGHIVQNRVERGYGMAWCATSDFGFPVMNAPGGAKHPVKASQLVPGHIIAADGYVTMGSLGMFRNPAHSGAQSGKYGVYEVHVMDGIPGANYLFADHHVEWSDTFGHVPSPMYFGLPSKVANPPIWVHP